MESKPGSLESLAPELLQDIMVLLPDFDSLWCLLNASPHALRIFNTAALFFTENILSSPMLPLHVQELIRAVILARASALPFRSLEEFHITFLRGKLPRLNKDTLPNYALTPGHLTAATPSAEILISVIAAACHISALTSGCLNSYLARVRDSSTFTPQHCHEPKLRYMYRNVDLPEHLRVSPWLLEFRGEPVEVVDAGPPSWVEEMRVRRALWVILLVGEVKRAASSLKWSREDIESMELMSPEAFAEYPRYRLGPDEEIKTVNEYLMDLDCSNMSEFLYYRLPQPSPKRITQGWEAQAPEACEETCRGIGYRFDYGNKIVIFKPPPEDSHLYKNIYKTETNQWGQTRSALAHLSTDMARFTLMQLCIMSPLHSISFDPFRRLGLAIWDKKRMHFLGLSDGIGESYNYCFYFFAWKSLLSAEEFGKHSEFLENRRNSRIAGTYRNS